MNYTVRREDRAEVLAALQRGAYEAIVTSGQGALDELVHLAIELGMFEALKVVEVRRERVGIEDELLLRTLSVLPYVEAMGLNAAARELFRDAAILLQLGYSIEQLQQGFNARHHPTRGSEEKRTPYDPEVLRQEAERIDPASLAVLRQRCVGEVWRRKLVKGRICAVDGSDLGGRGQLVGLMSVHAQQPLWLSWRILESQASETGKEGQVVRDLVDEVRAVAGADAIEWLVMDAKYADGALLAWLEHQRHIHVLVRLSPERLLYHDLTELAEAQLLDWKRHTETRYVSGHKQVRRLSVVMAGDLTSWDSYLNAATAAGAEHPTLWAALIRAVDVTKPETVEEWALVSTTPFPSAWAAYRPWRQRWCIENQGFRELKEGWHLEKAPWSWTNQAAQAARITFTLIAFNVAQVAKTAKGRQLTQRGIRRLRRELCAHYGPAPVIVFTANAFAVFHIEEILCALNRPPQFSLRPPPPSPSLS